MAWHLIRALAEKSGARIIPVDSEHSAIFSLIEKIGKEAIAEILITASGGPFRTYAKEDLARVSVKDALAHPTWKMGKKITIDSATLANKELEVIEACLTKIGACYPKASKTFLKRMQKRELLQKI